MKLSSVKNAIKSRIKHSIGQSGFGLLLVFLKMQRWYTGSSKIPVLMFHKVLPAEKYGGHLWTVLEAQLFEDICAFVAKHFRSMTLTEMLSGKNQNSTPDFRPPVLLTFDDGWQDNLSYALPILEKYRLHSVLFVATSFTENGEVPWPEEVYLHVMQSAQSRSFVWEEAARHWCAPFDDFVSQPHWQIEDKYEVLVEFLKGLTNSEKQDFLMRLRAKNGLPVVPDEFKMLSLSQLRTVAAHPLVELGFHTHTHPILSQLTEKEAGLEIERSRRALQAWSIPHLNVFAFPNGRKKDYNAFCVSFLKNTLRTACSFTTEPGYFDAGQNKWEIPRIGVGRGTGVKEFKTLLVKNILYSFQIFATLSAVFRARMSE